MGPSDGLFAVVDPPPRKEASPCSRAFFFFFFSFFLKRILEAVVRIAERRRAGYAVVFARAATWPPLDPGFAVAVL